MWISFFKHWIHTRLSNHCMISKPPGSNCSRLIHLKTVNIYINIWWVIIGQESVKTKQNWKGEILHLYQVYNSCMHFRGVQNYLAVYRLSVLEGQCQSQRHHPLLTIWNPLHACINPKLTGIRVDKLNQLKSILCSFWVRYNIWPKLYKNWVGRFGFMMVRMIRNQDLHNVNYIFKESWPGIK